MKVLSFGSLNIDYVYHVDHIVNKGETLSSTSLDVIAGGKGLNQSIALAKAGAEVYLAKGEVKGGFEIFGIKIETEVEGKIGAIGAKVGGEIEDTSVEAEIGASLLGGAGIKVKIDWSEFADGIKKWKW